MKIKLLLTIIVTLVLLTTGQGQPQNKPVGDSTINELRYFYSSYMTLFAKSVNTEKELASLRKKYCTNKLITRLAADELDYDPIINGQDANVDDLKTLVIAKDVSEDNRYNVSYIDEYSKKKITIRILVLKVNGHVKIDEIL